MSDFDEEAERERLREKYEREEQKREVTEKMSELLLKGATMTNAHCQECGDPIFRYDGQEFCATCERAVKRDDGDGSDEADADDAATAANGDREEIEVASPDETRVKFGGDTAEPTADDGTADADANDALAPSGDETAQPPQDGPEPTPSDRARTDQSRGGQHPTVQPGGDAGDAGRSPSQSRAGVQSVDPGEGGDLATARAALSGTVTQLAQQAAAAEDLGRKRDLLAATEEAAEALAAVREADR